MCYAEVKCAVLAVCRDVHVAFSPALGARLRARFVQIVGPLLGRAEPPALEEKETL